MFNKEKRQEKRQKDKATKENLKEQIKPRPTFAREAGADAKKRAREEANEKREEPIRDRLKALHAGETGSDVAQMGSDLLYIGQLSSVHFQVQDQFSLPEKCMTRWTVHGKHDKEFLGMAPTGRRRAFRGVTVSYFHRARR